MAAVFQQRTSEAGAAVLQLLQLVTEAAQTEERRRQAVAETVLAFGNGFKDDSWVERCERPSLKPQSRAATLH